MKAIITAISLFAGALFLVSCSDNNKASSDIPKTTPHVASEALSKVFAPVKDPAVSILKARSTAKPGETLSITGVVMGNVKPFVEGRAVFILGDPEKLTTCDRRPGDDCKTPWDACCDAAEDIKAATVTVQVVDADGKVLKEPIENVNGLKPLSTVAVTGVVDDSSNENLLILNARSIQVTN